jgi:hypothetical protein
MVTVPEMAGSSLTAIVSLAKRSVRVEYPPPTRLMASPIFAVTVPAIVCVPVGLAVTVPAIVTVFPTVTDAIETG